MNSVFTLFRRWTAGLLAGLALCAATHAQDAPSAPPEYRLGMGDSIRVLVFQNTDLTLETRVSENGTITFPLVGAVKVGNLTIAEAEHALAAALEDGGFIQKPQVNIVLLQNRGNQVSVLGMVNHPGRYPLETVNLKVSEVVALAGGIAPTGADMVVLTGIRDGKAFRREIDIARQFVEQGGAEDPVVAGGDVLYVDRQPTFYIYGEVQRPGAYRIERGMTVMQALAEGGGLTARGTERWMRVSRLGPDGSRESRRIHMEDKVQADDVLYVRESLF